MEEVDQIFNDFFNRWSNSSISEIVISLIVAVVIFIIGRWIARLLTSAVDRALQRSNVDITLRNFLRQITYYGLLAVVFVMVLAYLGIPTTSLVAILGASTLAIGLALQDTLGNFAAGILIIFLKPYRDGDLVEIGDKVGAVREVGFFHTELRTPDNKIVLIPNSDVMDGNIINYSEMDWIRVDMTFGIGYDDDLLKAKRILQDIVAGDERVTSDPAPIIAVEELGDNSVNLAVRPYVKLEDFVDVRFDITEKVKLRFDEEGISIPFPQRDVHLVGSLPSANGG
ncbi:MAG: mechanosensitive ion channel [Candidatus Promineifilaceae bacterium]|nr:mechanosensitive ion channel [Candidatus Promineifilaceae bacterium]